VASDRGDGAVREELVARLLDLCDEPAVTGCERSLCDRLEARLRGAGEHVLRVGDSLVAGDSDDPRPRVLLVGHLDVVPPTDDDRVPRVEARDGGDVVVARGAADMHSGNAVAMHLFADAALRSTSPYALALVLYAGEEGPAEGNQLEQVLAAAPWLCDATLAVVLEPTGGGVELGCNGVLHAEVTFRGTAAHSARPWLGRNALTAAGGFLAALEGLAPVDHVVDGLVFRDVVVATRAWTPGLEPGGHADGPGNVVPERFTIDLNHRFAPARDLAAAEAGLRATVATLLGDADAEVAIVDRSPAAAPHRSAPAVAALIEVVGGEVTAKQGWTDVARFVARGVPALNLGPGTTEQAHRRGEHVAVDAMVAVAAVLRRFLGGEAPASPGATTPTGA
jgi:succinyl-diaminopimelate desuccinylase